MTGPSTSAEDIIQKEERETCTSQRECDGPIKLNSHIDKDIIMLVEKIKQKGGPKVYISIQIIKSNDIDNL